MYPVSADVVPIIIPPVITNAWHVASNITFLRVGSGVTALLMFVVLFIGFWALLFAIGEVKVILLKGSILQIFL